MTASALRALLASGRVLHVPGVHDPITAALAVRAGHRAVHLSGTAVAATMLGRPDVQHTHGARVADRASTLASALDGVPLLADADTGYGDPAHMVWTALAYSRAGVSGLILSDRPGRRSSEKREMSGTLTGSVATAGVAETGGITATAEAIRALAEQAPEIVIIARTRIHPARGLDETIVRCRAYAEAGADAVFPEGVDTLADLAKVHAALPGVPLVLDRSGTAARPEPATDADLADAGVRLVLHPMTALLAAMRAASLAYRAIAETGSPEPVDRMPWAAFTELTEPETATAPDARYVPANLQT
ncbi:isocitrate lyase/PEP mutase family protein [Actinoplanes sp. G11-F43]|uniref:isocitrate lyase/PEP mutase family protein n=1 Tax=Actinoplanes sp. G11-F43 TaxID=3424130 RepID=UPI003D331D91